MVGGCLVGIGHVVGDRGIDLEAVFFRVDEEGEAVDPFLFQLRGKGVAQGTGDHTLRQAGGKTQAGLWADRGFAAGDVFFRTGCQGQQQGKEGG